MQELAWTGPGQRRRAAVRASGCDSRRHPRRDVAVAIAAAPAQNVSRMLAAPAVNHLGRHLEFLVMLMPGLDQGPEVVDDLGGGVVSDMRAARDRVVVDRATRGARPGPPGRGRPLAFLEISVNPHDIWRAIARGKPGNVQAPPADRDVNALDKRHGPGCLPVDAHHLGLLDRLVQMIALAPMA